MEQTKNSLYQKIRDTIISIEWENYKTVSGSAAEDHSYDILGGGYSVTPKIETLLLNLFSDNSKIALQASYHLWNELCPQTQVASAALPAYDILLLGVQILNDNLKVEILDILYNMIGGIPETDLSSSWKIELRTKFKQDKKFFANLIVNDNEDIAAFAELIVDQL